MTWCIALFTTVVDADAIVGDLHEERLAIAMRDGERVARRWYWRQVLRTIAQLAIAPLRESPLTFLFIGVLGFGLILPMTWATFWFAGQILVRVQVYQFLPATVFWWAVSVVPYVSLGALGAVVTERRAMSGALAVVIAMAVWVAVINPMLLMTRLPPERVPGALEYLAHTLPWFSMYGLATLSATAVGVAIRQRRAARRATHAARLVA